MCNNDAGVAGHQEGRKHADRCRWAARGPAFGLLISLSCLGCGQPDYLAKPRPSPPDEDPPPQVAQASPTVPAAGPSLAANPAAAPAHPTVVATSAAGSPAVAGVAPESTPPAATSTTVSAVEVPLLKEHADLGVMAVQPNMNLTEQQRRRHAIGCLKSISLALERYMKQHSQYPDQCIDHPDFGKLLSWRVALLPYLGYEDLYKQFKLEQAWDSPHNQQLLAQIPPVYRSPERADTATNFLLFTGSGTSYSSVAGTVLNLFLDGPQATLLLAEFDNSAAVPWTKPVDFPYEIARPREGLFELRGDGFFGIFGAGYVRQVQPSVSDTNLRAILTMQGDEQVPLPDFAGEPSETAVVVAAASPAAVVPRTDARVTASVAPVESVSGKPAPPTSSALSSAESLVRTVYEPLYKQATTPAERKAVASRMVTEAETVRHDLPNYFVMLRIARDIATGLNEIDLAAQAQEKIDESFAVDALEFTYPWVDSAVKRASDKGVLDQLFEVASREFEIALEQDDFASGDKFQDAALSAARKSDKPSRVLEAAAMGQRLSRVQKEYKKVMPALHTLLRSPADPAANAAIGEYLCLVKGDWSRGLTHLAKSDHENLKTSALMELETPGTSDLMAELGDKYWTLAEAWSDPDEAQVLKERSAFWYRQAFEQIPEGLRRILIRERLQQVVARVAGG